MKGRNVRKERARRKQDTIKKEDYKIYTQPIRPTSNTVSTKATGNR